MTWFKSPWSNEHGYIVEWRTMTLDEEREVLAVLDSVGSGVTAEYDGGTWGEVFAGNVTWRLSSGWTVTVFNDCDSWDYVDRIEAPDGRWWEFKCGDDVERTFSRLVENWTPKRKAKAAWLLPKGTYL